MTKSPIFSAFTAQIAGLCTIRAFDGAAERLHREFLSALNVNGRCWHAWLLVNRWVGFRLDMLSFLVLAFACLGPVLAMQLGAPLDPGMAGFAITYAIALSGTFQYCVRVSARVETFMTCAERLLQGSWVVSMFLLESSALARETVSRDAAGVAAALSAAYGAAYAVRRPSCLHAGAPRGRHACSPARRRRRASSTRCWSAR